MYSKHEILVSGHNSTMSLGFDIQNTTPIAYYNEAQVVLLRDHHLIHSWDIQNRHHHRYSPHVPKACNTDRIKHKKYVNYLKTV